MRCQRSRRGGGLPHPTHARGWCELIPTPAVVRPAPPPDHCAMPNPRQGTPNHKGSEPGRFPCALAGDRWFGGTLSAQCRAVQYTRFEENESRCSAPSAWNFIRYHTESADPLARARRPEAERAAHCRRGPRFSTGHPRPGDYARGGHPDPCRPYGLVTVSAFSTCLAARAATARTKPQAHMRSRRLTRCPEAC
jgi:hypothetical protein